MSRLTRKLTVFEAGRLACDHRVTTGLFCERFSSQKQKSPA